MDFTVRRWFLNAFLIPIGILCWNTMYFWYETGKRFDRSKRKWSMSVTISTAHHCTTAGMGSVGMMGTLNLVRPPQVPQVAALRAYVKSLSSVYKSNAEFLQVPCAFYNTYRECYTEKNAYIHVCVWMPLSLRSRVRQKLFCCFGRVLA